MRCSLCDGKIENIKGRISFKSKALGLLFVPGVSYSKCQNCGDELISIEMSKRIINYVKEKEQEAINSLPIGAFLSLNRAAEVLGITKQAFSKNNKINSGFIYSTAIDNKNYYYDKSVEAFKSKGDGRIPIVTFTEFTNITEWLPKSKPKTVLTIVDPIQQFDKEPIQHIWSKILYNKTGYETSYLDSFECVCPLQEKDSYYIIKR
jgi:hypothetical protein